MKKISAVILGTCTLLLVSCKGDRPYYQYFPEVAVSTYVYPNNPEFLNLQLVGGWAYVDGGIRGIIVYRSDFEQFVAYDRACPSVELQNCSTIEVTADQFSALCPCDSSTYELVSGSQIAGPGDGIPLLRYNTSWDGNTLYIYN